MSPPIAAFLIMDDNFLQLAAYDFSLGSWLPLPEHSVVLTLALDVGFLSE